MIGTFCKNKKEMPKEFLVTKHFHLCSSYFGFSENKVLVSYKSKTNKILLIVSTKHREKTIDVYTGI